MPTPRVIVLGAGPAGLAAAAALADRGALATLVAPNLRAAWEPRYGAWLDELEALGLQQFAAQTWSRPIVHTPRRAFELGSAYANIDGVGLQAWLTARCDGADVEQVDARARRVDEAGHGQVVLLTDGRQLRADLVIDATGAGSSFVHRQGEATAAQTAFGLDIEVEGHPWDADQMVFMDNRGGQGDPSTFLYAQPMTATRVFVEETSLAAGPPVSLTLLERRLYARLQSTGIRIRKVYGSERCWIPLDTPIPSTQQRVLPFGAAASFTHPATGYTLIRTLAAAEPMAAAVTQGLKTSRQAAIAAGMQAIWPSSQRLSRKAHLLGLQVLMGLDANQQREWFEAFFALPEARWRGMLAPGGDPSTVLGSMGAMALHAPRMVANAVYNRDRPVSTHTLAVIPEVL